MKRLIFFFVFLPLLVMGQKPYFQQRVDYKIQVRVYPEEKTLSAFETFVYKNNSPDTLHFLYIHLWPNGYTKNSALAKQQANAGKPKVQFDKEYRGYIDSLDFKVDGKTAKWQFYKHYKDIAILYLPEPLMPGGSVTVTTPFRVKIPKISSRMGYDDVSISISQWYPKPAVYDRYGWHPFPYLDQGEFYSEFGSFDVSITIPSQYVVAATGILQDSTEAQWWTKLYNTPADQVPYPTGKPVKTVRYYQDSVHDFAIFVSDKFKVRTSSITLPHSKRKVITHAFYTSDGEWQTATNYVDSAIYYYSLWVGDYPYKVASAVEGALTAGGGMEYPTITVIGMKSHLEQVIVHEVGHNWFYGILGFNERRYPFLDEGINSYYDHRYSELHSSSLVMNGFDMSGIFNKMYEPMVYFGLNPSLDLTSTDYTKTTYGMVVYEKMAHALKYLQLYLGTAQFDRIMQAFYEQWKFKHPYPGDLKQVFDSLATKPVSWFFDDVVTTTKLSDYKVKGTLSGTKVKNAGQFKAPMPVEYEFVNNTKKRWAFLQPGESKVYFPDKTKAYIDPKGISLDWYPYNNYTTGKLTNKPLKVSLIPKFYDYEHNHFAIAPLVYWRDMDGILGGLGITNFTFPLRKFNYALAGFYSFKNSSPEMVAYFNYKIPAANGRPAVTFEYYFDNFDNTGFSLPRKQYAKIVLDLFNKDQSDKFLKTIDLAYYLTNIKDVIVNDFAYFDFRIYKRGNYHPFKAKIFAYSGTINMAGAELNYKPVHYVSLNTGLNIRLFAGWQTPLNAITPYTDYRQSAPFISRYSTSLGSNQISEGYGNFTVMTPYASYVQAMNKFVTSASISSTLPVKALSFIGAYANVGYVSGDNIMWEGGLQLDFRSFKVYFPMAVSQNLASLQTIAPFKTFSFSIYPGSLREVLSKL